MNVYSFVILLFPIFIIAADAHKRVGKYTHGSHALGKI